MLVAELALESLKALEQLAHLLWLAVVLLLEKMKLRRKAIGIEKMKLLAGFPLRKLGLLAESFVLSFEEHLTHHQGRG